MAADTILGQVAGMVGATEPALRLLFSILVGKLIFILFYFFQIVFLFSYLTYSIDCIRFNSYKFVKHRIALSHPFNFKCTYILLP